MVAPEAFLLTIIHHIDMFTGLSGKYHIRGLFGGDFNLAVWRIFIGLPNLNYAILTRTHEMN